MNECLEHIQNSANICVVHLIEKLAVSGNLYSRYFVFVQLILHVVGCCNVGSIFIYDENRIVLLTNSKKMFGVL